MPCRWPYTKEILYYNIDVPHDAVQTYLLYSRYPLLYHIRHSNTELRQALALRNQIVTLERLLRNGHSQEIINRLDENMLVDPVMRNSKFYQQYLRKDLMGVVDRRLERHAGGGSGIFPYVSGLHGTGTVSVQNR